MQGRVIRVVFILLIGCSSHLVEYFLRDIERRKSVRDFGERAREVFLVYTVFLGEILEKYNDKKERERVYSSLGVKVIRQIANGVKLINQLILNTHFYLRHH
jgi:hypothetical protein